VSQFGRLPKRGESVILEGLKFQVLRADSRRLHSLLVGRVQAADMLNPSQGTA